MRKIALNCGQGRDWWKFASISFLKHDGITERFPVLAGDVAQASLRAALCQHPGDCVVVVTEEACIRVRSDSLIENGPSPTPR